MGKVYIVMSDDGECYHVVGVATSREIARLVLHRMRMKDKHEWLAQQDVLELQDPSYKRPGYTSYLMNAVIKEWEVVDG